MMARLYAFLMLLCCAAAPCVAKEHYEISPPVLLQQPGINKVLCMKNGYTMLLHFEINKPLLVQVYDTTRHKAATAQISSDLLDMGSITNSVFKGLFEENGEAVLFMEQQRMGRHTLIRLCISGKTGALTDEARIGRSYGIARPMRFFVMKHKKEEGYAVLFCEDEPQFRKSNIYIAYYDKLHESYRTVPLDAGRSRYDFMNVVGAEMQPEGICVSLGLSVMLVNGTTTSTTESSARYNHYLHVFYVPKGSTTPIHRVADLSTEVYPYYTTFTHNPFAGNINVLLLSYRDALYRNGIYMQPTALVSNLLFRLDEHDLTGDYSWFTNKLANSLLLEKTDTTAVFSGLPMKMYTNANGLTTVISEAYNRDITTENYTRNRAFETYMGNLCITQTDDNGKEIWGTVLPKSQYYRSYKHYYRPADIAKRGQDQAMFNDIPPQIEERQFLSAAVYSRGDNFYIIYNDCGKNIHNTIAAPGDTVYASALSNACYYRMNKKREITKEYLLGAPMNKEYKSCFTEGGDFDEERGVYATLIRYKRGEYVSMRMAWVQLD